MARSFLSINANYNDFLTLPSREVNKFVLENNEHILSKLYGFCQKNEDLLIVSGFVGTGKTQVVNHLLNYIDKNVYSFMVNCSNSLTLDDVLLHLWAQFISVAANSELGYRYRQTNSFQDRISGCFTESPSNIIITLFDFDLVQDKNVTDILDFLTTISKDEKIKIIIVSKTFDTTLLPQDTQYTKVILKALSRVFFEKYLAEQNIKATSRMLDELYKITRGYYLYTEITSLILNKKELSVNDYLVAYTNSGLSFDKFLAKAFVSMHSQEDLKLLRLLAVIRHPVNSQVLDYFDIYNQLSIDNLRNNKLIIKREDLFIINSYFRNEILSEMSEEIKQALHQELIKFYNSQLPLKPSERLLLISRTTMRAELEYHYSSGVPSNVVIKEENIITDKDLTPDEMLDLAEKLVKEYKYNEAIKIYLQVLERDETNNIEIYSKLADLYIKVGNWKYSLHYLNHLIKYYREINNSVEVNKIKLQVAQIYYQSYKTNEAINILYEIISESTDTAVTIEAYTILANIYISLAAKNKAYELYNKAIILSEREDCKLNLSELYFKFAILADENDEVDTAVEYYQKCINISEDNSKYKSLSYSNLGDFYLDINDKSKALENFKKAYMLDEKNSNDYGMYYSASNVAKLLIRNDSDEAYKYLLQAKTSAIKANDIFAMANAGLHLGDYFSNKNEPEIALNEFFAVYNLVKDKFSQENKKKIQVRIDDIKLKIGEERFNELQNK